MRALAGLRLVVGSLCVECLLQDSGCKMDAMLLLRRVLRLMLTLCTQIVLTCALQRHQTKRPARRASGCKILVMQEHVMLRQLVVRSTVTEITDRRRTCPLVVVDAPMTDDRGRGIYYKLDAVAASIYV